MASGTALVVDASGISGYNAAARLLAEGWEALGLSRRGAGVPDGARPIAVGDTGRRPRGRHRTESRSLGFRGFRDTRRTFLDLFERLRAARVIP